MFADGQTTFDLHVSIAVLAAVMSEALNRLQEQGGNASAALADVVSLLEGDVRG